MVRRQSLVFDEVEWFVREIISIQGFCAGWRSEKLDHRLRLLLSGEAAQSIFRHAGGRIPEGQFDGAPLVQAERAMPELKSPRQTR